MSPRKTKIICTLGPATEDVEVVGRLLRAGMNVARYNMAHGDHAYHAAMIAKVRQASRATGIPVALLIDIKGPEIRTGTVAEGRTVRLEAGSSVTVTTEDVPCTGELVSVTYRHLPEEIGPGKHVLIADGLIDLEVTAVEGGLTRCVVRSGGILGSHKNVNLVGVRTRLPAVTEKDVANLHFAVEQKLDFVAASFVRKAEDILEIRKLLVAQGSGMHIVAKIEDEEGLANIDDIIRVSDGVMIARGDLGVQLPTEEMPLIQKRIISKCHDQNKAVITATQMLDSMIVNPRPTRAEATDVANAIFDGTDAVMLSGETASGKYPELAVKTMDGIARAVEQSPEYESRVRRFFRLDDVGEDTAQAVSRSAFLVARDIRAAAILTPTLRGNTPRLISKYRPAQIVLAVTPSEEVQRRLLLYWGIVPLIGELVDDSDAMLNNALRVALEQGHLALSDKVVILAGVPVHSAVPLNLIRIHIMGNVLAKGRRGFGGYASGRVVHAEDATTAARKLKGDGSEILVTRFLTPDFVPLLGGVRAIVVEQDSYLDEAELTGARPGLVAVSAVPDATGLLEEGTTVTVHGTELAVYEGVMRKL
jgi:pyruvate kinase